jgi:hypothetical protein
MPVRAVHEFEAMGRTGLLSKTFAPYALILVLMVVACTVLVSDASLTPEQRIAIFQQSGCSPEHVPATA